MEKVTCLIITRKMKQLPKKRTIGCICFTVTLHFTTLSEAGFRPSASRTLNLRGLLNTCLYGSTLTNETAVFFSFSNFLHYFCTFLVHSNIQPISSDLINSMIKWLISILLPIKIITMFWEAFIFSAIQQICCNCDFFKLNYLLKL